MWLGGGKNVPVLGVGIVLRKEMGSESLTVESILMHLTESQARFKRS